MGGYNGLTLDLVNVFSSSYLCRVGLGSDAF